MADPPPPSGSGEPEDAFRAFSDAAAKWSAAAKPDPQVSEAVALGWFVGEALTWAVAEPRGGWAGISELGLDAGDLWAVLSGRIVRTQHALVPHAEPFPTDPPETAAVKSARTGLLKALAIESEALGKAFLLGSELQQLCEPVQPGDVRARLVQRIPPVKALLIDLATKLPPNVSHSVRNSLTLWQEQVAAAHDVGEDELETGLLRQGRLWRAILTGELAARDVLRVTDYVGTAEEVVRRLRELSMRALRRLKLPVAVIVALLAVGVVIVWRSGGDRSHALAGASSLIAAFGLSWKGIGAFFGHAAAQGEQALWDAEMDWAIAYRATISVLARPSRRHRVKRSLACRFVRDSRRKERARHLVTWEAWRERWPALDDEALEALPARQLAQAGK